MITRNIYDILDKNIGRDSAIKFTQTEDGGWYFIGYGGMGTTIYLPVEEELTSILNEKLENGELILIEKSYCLEIGKMGCSYYHEPKK